MNIMAKQLCSKWGSFLGVGIVLVLLGALALLSVFFTTLASVVLLGVILVGAGIAQFIHAFWAPEWKGFFVELFLGILSAVVGGLMVMNPVIGAIALTLMLASYFIASGLFRIATALFSHIEHWGWLLFNGIITLILGILLIMQWPMSSLWVLGTFIGIDLILSGWSNIFFSFTLRKQCETEKQSGSV